MPLIHITTKPDWAPTAPLTELSGSPAAVAELARRLPKLIAEFAQDLGLDPLTTPEEGTQVTFGTFGPCDVNVPNIGFFVIWVEPLPSSAAEQMLIREKFEEILIGLLATLGLPHDESACDMFWGRGRGFIRSGPTEIRW